MNFSKLRHRIIFLKPMEIGMNTMGEIVPVWVPFKPYENTDINSNIQITEDENGNAVLKSEGGNLYSVNAAVKEYAVWANVSPATGREYEEAQKVRDETTYKVITRYFPNITHDMKILFGLQLLDIIAVLNVGSLNSELQIMAKEKDRAKGEYS